jgi:hypothetical protein
MPFPLLPILCFNIEFGPTKSPGPVSRAAEAWRTPQGTRIARIALRDRSVDSFSTTITLTNMPQLIQN